MCQNYACMRTQRLPENESKRKTKEKIFERFFEKFFKIFEKKTKRKLPNLSNKMNRQLSKLEQSPATAPKTWCCCRIKLGTDVTGPKACRKLKQSPATAPKTWYAKSWSLRFRFVKLFVRSFPGNGTKNGCTEPWSKHNFTTSHN